MLAHGAEIKAKTSCEILKDLATFVSSVVKFRNLLNYDTHF